MINWLHNFVLRLRSALWFRPTIASVAAAVLALILAGTDRLLPEFIAIPEVDDGSVKELLKLLASAMLTVTTVTLSALLLVFNMVASQASPRALPGLMADKVTQNALSTFIATFVFAIAGILGLALEAYDKSGLSLLFGCGMLLTVQALRYLVQWMHHIAGTLRLGNIMARVHIDTQDSLARFLKDPHLGAHPVEGKREAEDGTATLATVRSAYLCGIDTDGLQKIAARNGLTIELMCRPGDFLHRDRPAMAIHIGEERLDDRLREKLLDCFLLGEERSTDQDPLLGLQILGEVASRALSPGINDPKTAIICLDRLEALLSQAAQPPQQEDVPRHDRLSLPALTFQTMLDRAMHSIARDGATDIEVVLRQIAALERIAMAADTAQIRPVLMDMLTLTIGYAEDALPLKQDREVLEQAAMRARRRLSGSLASAG
ncbi:DUF2254 domain-containing protein [Oceanibaculum nanhaiense]|uniref:DUF2254 domain-containing protein n=1 Tax=Oceanibaculum nanhaiense TaxID=1909734 RepID=UPI00396EA1F3